jgi:hypothetical protein
MTNFITHIYIKSFKSISACEIQDCRRINLFIGRPNVGKSNIIEALSAFTIPYLRENASKKLSNLIRVENETELFYNGNWEGGSEISTNLFQCNIEFHPKEALRFFLHGNGETYAAKVGDKLNVTALSTQRDFETHIKKYSYKHNVVYKKGHSKYLIPPFGSNLLSVVENYSELKEDVISLFSEYNLEVVFDKASQTIKIIQRHGNEIFLIPYNSIADTLQRIIFYKAAVISNDNCVLLFEEPEAHSFPPYMSHLTQQMIHKKDNQFFIATHSPFILNDLLEHAREELAVYSVDYRDKQTQVRQLSRSELHDIMQYGLDIFTNNESFI